MNQKIFITGLNSFTGNHLAKYFTNKGYTIFGMINTGTASANTLVADINDEKAISDFLTKTQPDYIIHLAAISFVQHSEPLDFYKINVLGTDCLLNCIVKTCLPKKIIIPSSATIYGNQTENILHEGLTPKPVNHYGISKWATEQLAISYFDKLPIIITRPFNYTGVGHAESFVIPKIIKHFKTNQPTIELGNINVSREFNDVAWVCEVYERLMLSTTNSLTVNICSGNAITLSEVIKIAEDITGRSINVTVNPAFVRANEIAVLKGDTRLLIQTIGELPITDTQKLIAKMLI